MTIPILITADEINCLVFSYLQDSGFVHSAFSLRTEGQLDNSPHFSKHIPRGELVELLSKALLYIEVEAHWKGDGMTANCKQPFSLLETHICSLDPPPSKLPLPPLPLFSERKSKVNGIGLPDPAAKRKASTPSTEDGRSEKRARRDAEEMEVDSVAKSRDPSQHTSSGTRSLPPIKPLISKVPIPPGPGDDETDPEAIRLLQGHKTEVFVCAWNPAKIGLLATGSKDAIVNIWNLPGPPKEGGFAPPHTEPPLKLQNITDAEQADLTSLDWNNEGTLLAIGSYDTILRIFTVTGDKYFFSDKHQGPIFATRFSKSGKWLLTASLDGTACVWDVAEKQLKIQYRSHNDCCLDVDWINEDVFASCGADQLIHIVKLDEEKPTRTLSGHSNEINQIKCNSSGTRLASCSDDQTARIWDISVLETTDATAGTQPEHMILRGHRHAVSSIGWCPDQSAGTNELVATSSFDGTARLWDSVTGDCLKVFSDHKRPVYALSFSPDGQWLATGSGDGFLHIYNVKSKEKKWSWYAGSEKPGVFEIDWQQVGNINRIALALECRQVGVVDITRVKALNPEPVPAVQEQQMQQPPPPQSQQQQQQQERQLDQQQQEQQRQS